MKIIITIGTFCLMSVSAFAKSDFASCSVKIDAAKKQIQSKTGLPSDEVAFLQDSIEALNICTPTKQQWPTLNKAVAEATKACDKSAAQGMSYAYKGMCYLKIADLANFILNK